MEDEGLVDVPLGDDGDAAPTRTTYYKLRVRVSYLLEILTLGAVAFLIVLWTVGWERAGSFETLSEVIATDPLVEKMFLAWYGFYVSLGCVLLAVFASEPLIMRDTRVARARHTEERHLGTFILAATLLKLLGLGGVALFHVTTSQTAHYVSTAIAFVSAILAEVAGVWRRRLLLRDREELSSGPTGLTERKRVALHVYSGLLIVTFVCAVVFAAIVSGPVEFVFVTLIMMESIVQVAEFREDTKDSSYVSGLEVVGV
jgi:hypothetical protein